MLRGLAALALLAALVMPGSVAAQSPPTGPPLGTLDDFQRFLTEHGFTRPLEPNTTTPIGQPFWAGWGGAGNLGAYAVGPADALAEVNTVVISMTSTLPAERDDGLMAVRDYLELYAPEALSEIATLDFTPPLDTIIELDDRLVRIRLDPDTVEAGIRLKSVGDIPIRTVPLATTVPTPRALVETFSGSGDFNTQRFTLDGGDYTTDQSAGGREDGCEQSTQLVGPTRLNVGRVLTGDATVTYQQNNLYDVPPGAYWFEVTSTCDWTASISFVAASPRPRRPPPWQDLP